MKPAYADHETLKKTLEASTLHEQWEHVFRTPQNEQFYEKAFDWIAMHSGLSHGAEVLDIGCGIGQHAVRLLQRGFHVVAADVSPNRVQAARLNFETHGLSAKIAVQEEDVATGLSFVDKSFDGVLCWGVLMHIYENERAMAELIRVTRMHGTIIISEANFYSFDAFASLLIAWVKKVFNRGPIKSWTWGRYGAEYLTATIAGDLFIRHTRMRALIAYFQHHGCRLRHHVAGQFTEEYRRFGSGFMCRLIHGFNAAWFAAGKMPYPAVANILIFEKLGTNMTGSA